MFKKKKKPVEIVPLQNPPRVLKVFKDYRLIIREIAVYSMDDKFSKYDKQLVLERKQINYMEEIYYVPFKTETLGYNPGTCTIENNLMNQEYLMFQLLKEIFDETN